jgi:protein-tyrosine kinase
VDGVIRALSRARFEPAQEERNGEARSHRGAGGAVVEFQGKSDPFRATIRTARPVSAADLKEERIVAFDPHDARTRAFDLLCNRLVSDLDPEASRAIAVSSPAHGCGVSVIAANLAFSIARRRQWNVLLADMGPQSRFGEKFGLAAFRTVVSDVEGVGVVRLDVEGCSVHIGCLSTLKTSIPEPAPLHRLVQAWLTRAKSRLGPTVYVLDLPPLLSDDDALPVSLHADAVVVALSSGRSTVDELRTCSRFLTHTRYHVVLNNAYRHPL